MSTHSASLIALLTASLALTTACAVGDGASGERCVELIRQVPEVLPEGCDDPRDLDGDGVMNCDDEDGDGDGLRNVWDRGPWDATVAELRVGGTGADGPMEIDGDGAFSVHSAQLIEPVMAGDVSLVVDDVGTFSLGQEILVLVQQGVDAGRVHHAMIAKVDGQTLEVEPGFKEDFSSEDQVVVQRVPHYSSFTLFEGVTLYAEPWDGQRGGVLMFRAQGEVRIAGTVELSGAGYRGGQAVLGNQEDPQQGESPAGDGAFGVSQANLSGGGAGVIADDQACGGGGGAFGRRGTGGIGFDFDEMSEGGEPFGDADLGLWSMGGGGGSGAPDRDIGDSSDTEDYVSGAGGAGGGALAIFSDTLVHVTRSGQLRAYGEDGEDAQTPSHYTAGDVGGGGGGAGGQLLLVSPELWIEGTSSALGGVGGLSRYNGRSRTEASGGGDGGDGRVRLDVDEIRGTTNPIPEIKSFPRRPTEREPYVPGTQDQVELECSAGGYFAGGAHGS